MTTNGVPDSYFTKAEKGPYTLCSLGDNGMVGRGAAAYVVDNLKAKNGVFFLPDYAYGRFAFGGAEAILKQLPGVKYNVVWSPVGTADVTPFLIKALEFQPDFKSAKGPAKWRVDGRPQYKYNSWIVEGKGPAARKHPKWDYAKIIDVYAGDAFLPTVREMGW